MAEQTCIVCGKSFDDENGMRWNHEGAWYFFDDLGCRVRFIGDPQKFLEPEKAST